MTVHGTFHWNELMTSDVEAAKSFYGETIGWSFEAFPMAEGTYWVAMQDGKPAGGIMDVEGAALGDASSHWMSYLTVDDVDARLKRVTASGGKVCREPFDVPNVGRIAIVQDATGAKIGWITPAAES